MIVSLQASFQKNLKLKWLIFSYKKQGILIHAWSGKSAKGTVVNWTSQVEGLESLLGRVPLILLTTLNLEYFHPFMNSAMGQQTHKILFPLLN